MPDEKTPQNIKGEMTPEKSEAKDLPEMLEWDNINGIPKGILEIAAQILTGFLIRTAPDGTRIELSGNNDKKNKILFLNNDEEIGELQVNFNAATDEGELKLVDKYGRGLNFTVELLTSENVNITLGSAELGYFLNYGATNGFVALRGLGGIAGSSIKIQWSVAGDNGDIKFTEPGGKEMGIEWVGSTVHFIADLPTSNPGGSNRLWNDGGTVKIT